MKNIVMGLKVLTKCVILSLMKKKSLLKRIFGGSEISPILPSDTWIAGVKEIREVGKRQIEILSRLGGNPIVMKMGN